MCTASSHAATCAAPASASEYTAKVRIPRRRAVRATRQAISPRFAISSFENIALLLLCRRGLRRPRGRPLVEERGDAFPTFGRYARVRDALGGGRQQHVVHGRFDDIGEKALRRSQCRGARGQQLVRNTLDFAV